MSGSRWHSRSFLTAVVSLIPSLAVYSYLSHRLDFVQDDAFITYRYAANYLGGHGLVYNVGERVEGITNHGWAVILLFGETMGLGHIWFSRLLGFVFGAGVILLTYLVACRVLKREQAWLAAPAVWLVGVNLSLAYWAPSGLETAAFAFTAMLSVYLYLRRSNLLLWTLALAVWLRPEGALVAGLLVLVEVLIEKRLPRFTLINVAGAFVISLPFAGYKLLYYGSILPNSFYAKTGLSVAQLAHGAEYVWMFLRHYGGFGATLILPVLLWRRLDRPARAVWLFTVSFGGYILLVGGDVLEVHRFFVPLFGFNAILAIVVLRTVVRRLKGARARGALAAVTAGLLGLTWMLPQSHVLAYRNAGLQLCENMSFLAQHMKRYDRRDFSLAGSTIGALGYELLGHTLIDMVGLTDTTVARHPEAPVPGLQTDWREPLHNAGYVLSREPDYIVFSTGLKPTSPGEKALLLYPQFLESYRSTGWVQQRPGPEGRRGVATVYRRFLPVRGTPRPSYPIEYVEFYKTGLDYQVGGNHRAALEQFERALEVLPPPGNPYVSYRKGVALMAQDRHGEAIETFNSVCARDSLMFEAHKDLYRYAVFMNDSSKAEVHAGWVKRLVPWMWPEIEGNVRGAAEAAREAGVLP